MTRATAVVLALAACSGPRIDEDFVVTAPSRDDFPAVGQVLAVHCGTLDCHGDAARNLRIYSIYGLRLDENDVTGFGGTTDGELDRTYESISTIEPERLSRIVRAGGSGAGDWLVLGKGRGIQHHAGGSRLVVGQPADTCLLLWIAGRSDAVFEEACQAGGTVFPPNPEW